MCLPLTLYKIEREWKHVGLSCAVVLSREGGHRCGYVRVPPGHLLHGKGYDEPVARAVRVHGRLRFACLEPCTEHEDGQGWWFGFDCARAGDSICDMSVSIDDLVSEEAKTRLKMYLEIDSIFGRDQSKHYWLQGEVEQEVERLAEQLAAV